MSKWRDEYSKHLNQRNWKELTARTKAKQAIERIIGQAKSKYIPRQLGESDDGPVDLWEESRASHIHILGTTREGKSKFLEMMLSQDIGRFGATLLDPSDNGQTCYNVLKWAIAAGFEKVCLIDPHDANIAIPSINPLRWKGTAAQDSVVQNIMESIRLLWGQTSFSDTPRIETYLAAVLTALYRAKATIPDAVCFLVKEDRHSQYQRLRILDHLPAYDKSRLILEEVFNAKGQQLFLGEFKPSIRRLSPFFDYVPRLIYGSTEAPIDFRKLISEKWLILVNLDKTRLWGTASQRVLGTLIVNEIISAISDLREHGWEGRHYLYIDEAGQFATRVLADIMAYKGKSGLWATLSHQFYNQFEDKYVLDAVENLCKIKVMFHTPNSQDRARMVRDMYTGDLKQAATDSHANLKKQHAVIKIGKESPRTVAIKDVNTPDISAAKLGEWKEQRIYKANPWYRSAEAVQEEIHNRFAYNKTTEKSIRRDNLAPQAGSDTQAPKRGTGNDGPTTRKGHTVRRNGKEASPDTDKAQAPGGEGGANIPISSDLRPDYSDAKPFRKRRPGGEEQGGEREGGEG